jgi:signal transduction histidine kinase
VGSNFIGGNKLRQQTFELEHKVRQRTAELEKERSQLRTVFDTIDDFVYIVSEGYRIEFMNRVMVETFGDHIGGTCYQVLYNRSSPCEGCPMPLVLRNQTLRDERFIPKTDRTYEIIHTPLKTAKGKFQKLATYRDITVRKLAEEKLLESNRELDAFVYTVSHDLRNPLTAVIGYADLMMEEYREQLDEQGLGMLKEIEAQGTRMSDLLEDLLDLARVGHIESPAEIVEVKEVVRNILIDHSESIKVKQITVEVTALPTLIIPATFLSQIFSNLIENAIRYAGKPGTSIEIGSERGSGQVRLYVRDHGPGIPEEERSRVFEVFFRGSAGQNLSGTGIGLATVRKIVQLYNGRVWVEETPRGGSTFWMEFPN